VKALLDTHIWIWWLLGSDRLSARERQALDQLARDGNAYLSAMSLWEAQMLHSKGRLSTARVHDLALATHDRAIRSSGVVPIWTPLD